MISSQKVAICGAVARRGAHERGGRRKGEAERWGDRFTIEEKRGGDVALMPRMQTRARVLGGGEGQWGVNGTHIGGVYAIS